MGLLNIIRRMALREKLPLREIARRTGMSRNTIKKYLNADTIEPQFTTPERQSKLDPFADKLTGWLKTEAGKSRKQRRTCKQLHADLVVLGFDGSCGRVAAFARDWRTGRQRGQQTTGRGTFVPLSFRPGEAFRFDWPIPVILGFCRAGRRAHEAAGCPHQAVAQPGLPGPGVSAANACPPRDISCGNALSVNGCCSMRIGTDSGSLAASRSVGFTTAGVVRHWSEELPVDAPSVQAPLATDMKTAVDRVGRGKERRVCQSNRYCLFVNIQTDVGDTFIHAPQVRPLRG